MRPPEGVEAGGYREKGQLLALGLAASTSACFSSHVTDSGERPDALLRLGSAESSNFPRDLCTVLIFQIDSDDPGR